MKPLCWIGSALLILFLYSVAVPYLRGPPETRSQRTFTLEELSHFASNDEGEGEVYLSFMGTVFDVSSGSHYRKSRGAYHIYAGHECAKAIVNSDLAGKLLDVMPDDYDDKKAEYDYWAKFYSGKYPAVGKLVFDSVDAGLDGDIAGAIGDL